LPHIFERFRQVDSSTTRSHGGLGLGLAIVRHLVEGHGGSVHADSDGPGQGATFTVDLPIRAIDTSERDSAVLAAAEAEAEAAASGIATHTQEKTLPLREIRILVVEDDEDSLELIRTVLEEAGAQVVGVASGRAALEHPGPFDVIISDIGMPEMDGYTLMRQLRSQASTASIPAIALTAYAREEDAERAIAAGYRQHISKPVESTQFVRTVQRVVQQQAREGSAGGRSGPFRPDRSRRAP
jgi:CheY-like chemotaxis protein